MLRLLRATTAALLSGFRSRRELVLENLALRQQLATVLQKRRPLIRPADRAFWVVLRRLWSRWSDAIVIVKPKTVIGWHRAGFALYWRWLFRTRKLPGRPAVRPENTITSSEGVRAETVERVGPQPERGVQRESYCGRTLANGRRPRGWDCASGTAPLLRRRAARSGDTGRRSRRPALPRRPRVLAQAEAPGSPWRGSGDSATGGSARSSRPGASAGSGH